jgi:ribonuclease D
LIIKDSVAVDSETMGLNPLRDRLCVVQLSAGDGDAHLVHFDNKKSYDKAVNLKKLLNDDSVVKIFHYARFDLAVIKQYLGVEIKNFYCTKIVSRLVRTYTDFHGLKELCSELLKINISKGQQSSNWGSDVLTEAQIKYAASDVLYLHQIRQKLDSMLRNTDRKEIVKACFDFLPTRVEMDLLGWENLDIFKH